MPTKDGTLLFYIDIQGLNQIMKKNRYPILLLSKVIDCLWSAYDFRNFYNFRAYHSCCIAHGDELETMFGTCYSHYKYTVIVFGLVNSLAAF